MKRRSPYQYIKTFYPDLADKHPFAFSECLLSVALGCVVESAATLIALDKETNEKGTFVQAEKPVLLLY